jgi:hypothetical protein
LLIALDPLQAPQHDVKLAGDLDCLLDGDGERELATGEEDLDRNVGVAGAERAFGSLGHSAFSHFLALGIVGVCCPRTLSKVESQGSFAFGFGGFLMDSLPSRSLLISFSLEVSLIPCLSSSFTFVIDSHHQ